MWQRLCHPAGGQVALGNGSEWWGIVLTAFESVGTTGHKRTTGRQVHEVRGLSFNGLQFEFAWLIQTGYGAQQPERVGMARVGVNGANTALLNDLASVHDIDPRRIAGHDAEIMRDQDDGDVETAGDVLHQLED